MKHLAVIQSEFLKQARKWEDLSYEDQKGYLSRHPNTRRKLTARPESSSKKLEKPAPKSTRKETPDIKDVLKQKKESLITVHPSETPKLDKKLGNLFDAYSKITKRQKQKDEDTGVFTEFDKVFKKEIPDMLSERAGGTNENGWRPSYFINKIDEEAGLSEGIRNKEPRTKPLSKEEFIQLAKDLFRGHNNKLPKVEGEEDPSKKEMKEYGLKEPLLSTEKAELKKLENELPEDQKKLAKYLLRADKRTKSVVFEDTTGDRPIMKVVINYDGRDADPKDDKVRYDVPASGNAVEQSIRGVGGLEFGRFDTLDEAKEFIKKAPKLEENAKLRDEIDKVNSSASKVYEKTVQDIEGWASPMVLGYIADGLAKYPREDTYHHHLTEKDKGPDGVYKVTEKTDKTLAQKGIKFNLDSEAQKNIERALSSPISLTPENLEKAINDFDNFIKDVKIGKDSDITQWKKEADTLLKNKSLYKKALNDIVPKVRLKNKLVEQHGYEKSKADLTLPKGFKFKDKTTIGSTYGDDRDDIIVSDDDDTMEMVVSLGKPGGYGKYGGEVYYTVPGQAGSYSIGRSGIDSGLSVGWNDDRSFAKVVEDTMKQVKEKQDRIGKMTVKIPLFEGHSWNTSPDGLEKIKAELNSGKSHTFAPHGMGTAYVVSRRGDRYSKRISPEAEKLFGVSPLYASTQDWD